MTTASKIPPTPKLITLNCSGGISLGAYMAGVFYELTKEAVKPDAKIQIDIITGASAGAMSGVLAAYCLLSSNKNKFYQDDGQQNPLYQAWVEQADIQSIDSFSVMLSSFKDGFQATVQSFEDSLQKTIDKYSKSSDSIRKTLYNFLKKFKSAKYSPQKFRQRKTLSVLSGKAIEDIAKLVKEPPIITKDTKPLALLMTLTNLQGLLEEVNLSTLENATERNVKAITSAETRQFLFHSTLPQETVNEMWAKAVAGSRASGAFPVAFPPIWDDSSINSVNLQFLSNDYFQESTQRTQLKYEELGAIRKNETDNTQLIFLYSDGGILDSLPLLKGIELEANLRSNRLEDNSNQLESLSEQFIEKTPVIESERLDVYIRPIPVENLSSEKRLTQGYFSMLDVGISGVALPSGENDSIRIKEIYKRNQLVLEKKKLLNLIRKQGSENLNQIENRLEKAIPYQHIELRPITAAILGDILDSTNHPKLSKLYPIYAAMPDYIQASLREGNAATLLASDFLGAFGGFFDKRYRVHDFLIGRICGIAWLVEHCDVEISDEEVQEIAKQIKTKILEEDPTPSDLKLSQKIRIGRIILRTIRIVVIESKIIGLFWLVILGILKVSVILLLAIFEVLATVFLIICDLMEKMTTKSDK